MVQNDTDITSVDIGTCRDSMGKFAPLQIQMTLMTHSDTNITNTYETMIESQSHSFKSKSLQQYSPD